MRPISHLLRSAQLTFSNPAIHCACVYGGAPSRPQLSQLASGPDLIVATPGRCMDFLERGLIDLSEAMFLVLDEADRMLDMGFEPQLKKIVVQSNLPNTLYRQTLMFSATFATNVQKIARDYLKPEYVFVSVGRVGSTTGSITQSFIRVDKDRCSKHCKLEVLQQSNALVMGQRTIVFTQKKHVANWLKGQLKRAGHNAEDIHQNQHQKQHQVQNQNHVSNSNSASNKRQKPNKNNKQNQNNNNMFPVPSQQPPSGNNNNNTATQNNIPTASPAKRKR